MRVMLLKEGDEDALIEAAHIFNGITLSRARAVALLADPTFVMVVAETGAGELMGRIYGHELRRLDQTDLILYEVDVEEHHQRKGAARAMLEFMTDLCRERRYGEWFVLTELSNAAGNAAYRSAGAITEGSPANIYVRKTR